MPVDQGAVARAYEQVNVIGHKGPSEELEVGGRQDTCQAIEKLSAIGVAPEDGATFDTAGDDVVESTGGIEARATGHETKHTPEGISVKHIMHDIVMYILQPWSTWTYVPTDLGAPTHRWSWSSRKACAWSRGSSIVPPMRSGGTCPSR